MVDWLENSPDALSDGDLWGEEKGSYNFRDLEKFLEEHEKKNMKKKVVKGDTANKAGGGFKKAGDKKKKQVHN